jgi:hypothetical protein
MRKSPIEVVFGFSVMMREVSGFISAKIRFTRSSSAVGSDESRESSGVLRDIVVGYPYFL